VDAKVAVVLEGEESAALDELFALGGKRTLRGYSERQFLATTVSSIQIEYGVLIGNEGGRAFVLLDCGYASTQALSVRERLHAGYGAGLRIPSSFGVAGIDFAVPAGESPGSGKIHVGLQGTF
jgi:outer membrane translocation and assembly module TamA